MSHVVSGSLVIVLRRVTTRKTFQREQATRMTSGYSSRLANSTLLRSTRQGDEWTLLKWQTLYALEYCR